MNIKELAEQAGYLPDMFGIGHWDMPECKRFAELVAAAEREQCAKHYLGIMRDAVEQAVLRERESCAKLCEFEADNFKRDEETERADASIWCASAIRARGDKHEH